MTMSDRLCILLYSPISGHGHLDSWVCAFAALLLERGFRVLCMTPDSEPLRFGLVERGVFPHPRVRFLSWSSGPASAATTLLSLEGLTIRAKKVADRLHALLLSVEDHYVHKWRQSCLSPDMPLTRRVKKWILRTVVPCEYHARHWLQLRWRHLPCRELLAGKTCGMASENGFLCPREMARRVSGALQESPWQPDFMLNMYMDMYKISGIHWKGSDFRAMPLWGGIRFAPPDRDVGAGPVEGYYDLHGMRGVCFLDEQCRADYQKKMPHKQFGFLPDITYPILPDGPGELALELRARAGDRVVVFFGGSLDSRKGLDDFCRLVGMADPETWFFALVGRVYRDSLSNEARQKIDDLAAALRDNVLLHLDYIEDERQFNALMEASDIIYAVYRDFRHSSNMLSKAALFRKPIIVSERYLMGRRVRHYGIGVTVPEGNPRATLTALEGLRAASVPEDKFVGYLNDFCPQATGDALEDFILRCLNRKGS